MDPTLLSVSYKKDGTFPPGFSTTQKTNFHRKMKSFNVPGRFSESFMLGTIIIIVTNFNTLISILPKALIVL